MTAASANRIGMLHPKIRDEVWSLVNQTNVILAGRSQMLVVQGLRTFEEQNDLYSHGRTTPGKKVTNARGGQSLHNYGLAIDFALLIDGKEVSWDVKADWNHDHISDWLQVVKVFKDAGYEWGGTWKTFKDLPHFQKTFGHGWRDLLEKYQAGQFIDGTRYVKI